MKRWWLIVIVALLGGVGLSASPAQAQDGDCGRTPQVDFANGDRVRVSAALGRGRLYIYTRPTDDGVSMARLMPGDEVELLPGGPVCHGGQQFWRVPAPSDRSGWLPAAIELDSNPNNLYTLVLEATTPPSNSPLIYEDDFSTQGNWMEDQATGFSVEYHNERYSMAQLESGL